MAISTEGKGAFINGEFHASGSQTISSRNPAKNFEPIFKTSSNPNMVDDAVSAAKKALPAWSCGQIEGRIQLLNKFKMAAKLRQNDLATAISLEMGKPYFEAQQEADNVVARVDLVIQTAAKLVETQRIENINGEVRYHPQGITAILGPYNFPAHLINAYAIPALLTGNTIVIKPSEVCPLVGQIYAEFYEEAHFPAGVVNMIQGAGDIGKALVEHQDVQNIIFTGSYETGKRIQKSIIDFPWKMCALEMGGKNPVIVMDDANLDQAIIEVVQGAYLTSGQRCTATSRLFLQRAISEAFLKRLKTVVEKIEPLDPFSKGCLLGPLATKTAFDRYESIISEIPPSYDAILPHQSKAGGSFATPSIYLSPNETSARASQYEREELFGPNLCVTIVDELDEAIQAINQSGYGLSNAIFTEEKSNFETLYHNTRAGLVNWNKSTNGAVGAMPFGGVGKSGNHRPAGIEAIKFTAFPVACNFGVFGQTSPIEQLKQYL